MTFAPNVGAALGRAGIKLGPDDRVQPPLSTKLAVDRRIEVRRAKHVVVVVNGSRSVEKVTGRTVSEVLKELSVAPTGASIKPAPRTAVTKGAQIMVAQPVATVIVHDGISKAVTSNQLTVAALLKEAGVSLGPQDRVEPDMASYPSSGTTVNVVRVNQVVEKKRSSIPFRKLIEKSDELELGVRKVKKAGAVGQRVRSYRVSYENGKVKSKVFIGVEDIRAPVDELVLVGTKPSKADAVKAAPSKSSSSRSSTGDASWYAQPGFTAAHPTLPFGTVVKVTNLANQKSVTVTIADRGPFSEGRIIDLSDIAFKKIAPLGAGVVKVKIEW